MAIRIPWDEYETAVLISACADYNAGRCKKKDAIKAVSQTLRKRAEDNGIEIDDVFRNENGISMQFMLANELLTQQKCGLRGAPQIFVDMVELYKTNRPKFQEILAEPKKNSGKKKTNQEQFAEWLSSQHVFGRISPAQMSELYNTYYDMDRCFQKEKILEISVLEITDSKKIELIKKMIMENGRFRFHYRRKIDKYLRAIEYYHKWLSEQYKEIETLKQFDAKTEEKFDTRSSEYERKIYSKQKKADEVRRVEEWNLKEFLDEHKLEYINKTEKNGCLWVLGGREIHSLMMQCWSHGVAFRFRQGGGNVTNGKAAWWARLSKEQAEHWKEANKKYKNGKCNDDVPEELDAENADLNEEETQLAFILKEDFENGFRTNSAIDRSRMKVFYNERYGQELALSEEQLLVTLRKVGEIRGERIYAKPDDEQLNLLKQIYEAVMLAFENGASCVYPEAIYQKYHFELAERLQIYEAELLGNKLVEVSAGRLRKKHKFLFLAHTQADLAGDVLETFKKSPIPMTYADIQEAMWYIPLDKIKHTLIGIRSIVQVEKETYFYSLNLPVSQEELAEVTRIIYRTLEYKNYITGTELRQLIYENYPGIAINTETFTTYGLRNCLGYILRESFSFNGPIITLPGKELSTADVFTQYCVDREQVTLEELRTLAAEMKISIYWNSVRSETIRISEELFLRCDKVNFAVDEIDTILNDICDGNYVSIQDLGVFMHFPPLCVQWNGYVLESYIHKYSKKFKLLHTTFSTSGIFGAMVRQDSGIENYHALIIDILANSSQWKDGASALQVLVDQGYQKKKAYADIEEVMQEAKLLREKINTDRE